MIANVTSGGGFGPTLDYLMNPKKGQEREPENEKSERQEPHLESERARSPEGTERAPVPSRPEAEPDESRGREGKEPESETRELEVEPEPARDLAEEYESGRRHRIIGGNMSGQTPRELEREFALVEELRPNVEKPVHHASLSVGEHDRLTVSQWQEIGDLYAEKMGFADGPFTVIQHRWSNRDHIHVLASRVKFDGEVVAEWLSKERAELAMRVIEEKYDLERVPSSKDVLRAAPTRAEIDHFNRTGELSAKLSLQGHVDEALREQPTATEFIERLERVGVGVIPYVQESGRMTGVTFQLGDERMKGSNLGRGFSWNALQERGLDYDEERDRLAVEAARESVERGRTQEAIRAPEQAQDLTPRIPHGLPDEHIYAEDWPGQRSGIEQLRHAAGGDPATKDAVELLQQVAGVEPAKNGHDALDRLSSVAGQERAEPSDPIHILDKTVEHTPELMPTLDRAAEEHVVEHVIEFML